MEIRRSSAKVPSSQPRRNRDLPHDYAICRMIFGSRAWRNYRAVITPLRALIQTGAPIHLWCASSKTEQVLARFSTISRLRLAVSCQDQRNQDDIMVPPTR
jgi:hypothetical protein